MKKVIYSLLLLGAVSFASCSDDDEVIIPNLNVEIEGVESTENLSYVQGEELVLKAVADNAPGFKTVWTLNGEEVSTESTYTFVADKLGENIIQVAVTGPDGGTSFSSFTINVSGKYKNGTFVLNEGNMSSENGFLTFIDPKGNVTDSVYYKENGTPLGNVTQDLFIADNKMYIMSQNGPTMGGEGFLYVANAETLKKEVTYNEELKDISTAWPTHVAVVGKNCYIRHNNGLSLFDLNSKKLSLIEGTKGAAKNRMAVVGDKVYVMAGKKILVVKDNAVINEIEMEGTISGVLKSDDNQLWVSCTTKPSQICKVSTKDYSVLAKHEIAESGVGAGWGATPGISAKGDTLYFSNAGTVIYRHIFNQNKTDKMCDVKNMLEKGRVGMAYNNLAVHPTTGEVYFTSIKGYGMDFLINDIAVFNFEGATPEVAADYQDHTHFPAGVFFTDSYK